MKHLAALAGAFVLAITLTTSSQASPFSATTALTTAAKQEQAAVKVHRAKAHLKRQILTNRRVTWRLEDKSGVPRTPATTIGWGHSRPFMRWIVRLWHDRADRARVRYRALVAQQARAAAAARTTSSSSGAPWDALAGCESSGDWAYNGPSGFDGGLQFDPGTWAAYRLPGYPAYAYQATREQQITVAGLVLHAQGWGAWPTCSAKLGLA